MMFNGQKSEILLFGGALLKRIGVVMEPQSMEESLIIDKPDISNLAKCIEDVKNAALATDLGPSNPTDYNQLRGRLEASRGKLPPLYQESVYEPFVKVLDELGREGFNELLLQNNNAIDLLFDIAHSILQNGEGYKEKATDAFQEVVSDLYDGFLSAEDRAGVKPPDLSIIAPLVKWGNPDFGPYTWPVDVTSSVFGLQTGIVSLPPANAEHGLLAWSALGHETGGHDILHADTGLLQELARKVRTELTENNFKQGLPQYWASKIDETASDVLGILNMGPAAGIGLIGYFRGLNAASRGEPTLRNSGSITDPHPADILRGYLAASTVKLLSFSGANDWSDVIETETNKDLSEIRLGGVRISSEDAKNSARIVASVIANAKLESLENHALSEIQNWRNEDELIVQQLRSHLTMGTLLPEDSASEIYATHVVAAAVTEALSTNANIPIIFDRMVAILKSMHDSNPSWGPLFIAHPGDLSPHVVYS